MIKISVIVPVYNTGKYLRRCLDSLVNQTLDNIEILVIEDSSPDNSKEILKEYEKKYDNIKVFHNKTNKGIGFNRNFGIENAKGEYISFIDSDDWISTNMYEKLYNKANEDKLDLVICNFHKMLEKQDGTLEEITPEFIISEYENTNLEKTPSLLNEVNLAPWNKLYKRSLLFSDVRFPEDLKYEDAIVTIKALSRAKKIGFIADKLNYYLVRNKSETTIMDKRVFDILKINELMIKELQSKDYYSLIKQHTEAFVIRNIFRYTLQQKNQKDKNLKEKFINDAFLFLDTNFPCWKKNKIYKKRNPLKRLIESNKFLTKLYCRF